jgi:uncharacterized cupredoxin-like copper-binding protein
VTGWLATAALTVATLLPGTTWGKGDLTAQKAIPVLLTLGSKDDKMVFTPRTLTFETGQLYKLLLLNGSPQKHEFDSTALSEAVFTHKVEVVSPEGQEIAEIVGAVREIEVGPGTTVEWYFVPVRAVKQGDIVCDLPGHKQAGMTATFSIQ